MNNKLLKRIESGKPYIFHDYFAGTQSFLKAVELFFEPETKMHFMDGTSVGYDKYGREMYKYAGFDIYSPEHNNIIIDLTQDDIVNKILKELPKRKGLEKPDFIWLSPVCNAYSTACAYKGGNLYFERTGKNSFKVREKWEDETNRRYTVENCKKKKKQYQDFAKLSLKMHENSKLIANHFNVPFVIENPASALSRHLYEDYKRNITNYCMYGFDYKKTTAIYSNREYDLLKCNHKGKHKRSMSGKVQQVKTYQEKSSVPPKLILEIIRQSLGD